MDIAEISNLRKTGAEALQRGDAQTVRDAFQRLADAGQADVNVWIALAAACGRLDDIAPALAAVDKALALEPVNLRALVVKGDLLSRKGDLGGATSLYMAALQLAPQLDHLTADLRADLQRANATCRKYFGQLESRLAQRLASAGLSPTARFAESLDLLFGRKHLYFQQPRFYFFPGLPQIRFYDRNLFPWLPGLEAATSEIRDELRQLTASGAGGPAGGVDIPLSVDGEAVAANASRCPRTLAALADLPLPRIARRSPSILFSVLPAGAHIPPRNGFMNTRLTVHLPLITPADAFLRVGNEERAWKEGVAVIFDDTIENEAWNRSHEPFAFLAFEIWRPELDEQERRLVGALFEGLQ